MGLSKKSLLSVIFTLFISHGSATPLFARSGFTIPEAPANNILEIRSHPNPSHIVSSARGNSAPTKGGKGSGGKKGSGDAVVNTIFSGVYPVVNVTWGSANGSPGQSFISFIDTGKSNSGKYLDVN
jgi:hypothetical protein